MASIAGVTTRKDDNGMLTHVTVDLKKHPEALSLLKQIGLIGKNEYKQENEQSEWLTVEEAKVLSLKHIDEIWKK